MYSELRKHRGLGQRGRLTPANEDLYWLPRSAVVAALSSLDAYVHAVLDDRIPHALRSNPIPGALCDAMADIVLIRNADSFRDLPPIRSASFEVDDPRQYQNSRPRRHSFPDQTHSGEHRVPPRIVAENLMMEVEQHHKLFVVTIDRGV